MYGYESRMQPTSRYCKKLLKTIFMNSIFGDDNYRRRAKKTELSSVFDNALKKRTTLRFNGVIPQ